MLQGFRRALSAPFHGRRLPARGRWGRRAQQGVSLLLALIFVAFFGGILVVLARFNSYEIRQSEARVAGWEIVEIAKAARLYVRDRYAADPNLRNTASTPNLISLNTLRTQGYLSSAFGRSAGGGNLSALNQRIYVIMANWSPAGLGGPTDLLTTVPSAFVYFAPGGKSTPDLVLAMVENARREGASVTAPLFDREGTNRSADCRGTGPAVGLWDTGCLTLPEFSMMASSVGVDPNFAGGGLIIPAWKAVQPDLRAVMRFPQPENPGYATMLTDLQMGTPVGDCTLAHNQVRITTGDAGGGLTSTNTGVCDVVDDDAANNRRFNITRIGNVQAQRVVAEPQAQDFGGDVASIGTGNDDALRIDGNLDLGSDLRIYNVRPTPAGVTHRFNVPNGTLAVERNTYLYSQNNARRGEAQIGEITRAHALISDRLETANFISTAPGAVSGSAPQMNVTTTTTLTGNVAVMGDPAAELITETLNATNAQIRATDNTGQVQVTGNLNMGNSTMTVYGVAPVAGYSAIIGEITEADNVTAVNNLQFLSPGGSLIVGSTRNYAGQAMNNLSTTGECVEAARVAGACPERQYYPPGITP